VLLLLVPALTGCNKLKARAELKQGNALYQNEQYRAALKQFQRGLELDPAATFAWRSVGLSALALYKPGDSSSQNRQYAEMATDAFEKYLADYPQDEKIREYLLSTYVNAKMYDKALTYLSEQARLHPDKAQEFESYRVRILIQSGQFERAEQLARNYRGDNRHEVLYSIGVGAWDKAYNDPELDTETRNRMVDTGLAALEQAIKAKDDYFEAIVYYNLLFREKAKLTSDPVARAEYEAKADEWRAKAQVLGKKRIEEQKKQQAAASQGQS
jgi:tetratricopeptide (TPR) repeat protein